jgi:hypothetical protein
MLVLGLAFAGGAGWLVGAQAWPHWVKLIAQVVAVAIAWTLFGGGAPLRPRRQRPHSPADGAGP